MIKEFFKCIQSLKKKENLESGANEIDPNYAIFYIIIVILWILVVLFIGKYLWNYSLAPIIGVKQVTFSQFLGIFIIIQILFPVCF